MNAKMFGVRTKKAFKRTKKKNSIYDRTSAITFSASEQMGGRSAQQHDIRACSEIHKENLKSSGSKKL